VKPPQRCERGQAHAGRAGPLPSAAASCSRASLLLSPWAHAPASSPPRRTSRVLPALTAPPHACLPTWALAGARCQPPAGRPPLAACRACAAAPRCRPAAGPCFNPCRTHAHPIRGLQTPCTPRPAPCWTPCPRATMEPAWRAPPARGPRWVPRSGGWPGRSCPAANDATTRRLAAMSSSPAQPSPVPPPPAPPRARRRPCARTPDRPPARPPARPRPPAGDAGNLAAPQPTPMCRTHSSACPRAT
jgi:hypothetical protein